MGDVVIGHTEFKLIAHEHCEINIRKFIAFCDVVYEHTLAPSTTLRAWRRSSIAIATKLKDINAPGFNQGGYHHTWLERSLHIYRLAAMGKVRTHNLKPLSCHTLVQ